MNILPITDKHATSYLIRGKQGNLLFDAGYPDSLPAFKEILKSHGLKIKDIDFFVVSHFHMDHAGLVQPLKNLGITHIIHEKQLAAPEKLNEFYLKKPDPLYEPIHLEGSRIISSAESREFLQSLGMIGEIIHTPGHTDDSISLVLDKKSAFVGDHPPLDWIEGFDDPQMRKSWDKILHFSVKTIYPAHGIPYAIEKNEI